MLNQNAKGMVRLCWPSTSSDSWMLANAMNVASAVSPNERPKKRRANWLRDVVVGMSASSANQTKKGRREFPLSATALDPERFRHLVLRSRHEAPRQLASGFYLGIPSNASSSSRITMRGVTISIKLSVSRPTPVFLNKRLM